MANKKEISKTEREYHRWRNIHYALKVAPYPTILVPFAVELGLNWSNWFGEGKDNTSIGLGLALAIVATFASVFAVIKKDSELMKKIGAFVSVGIGFVVWGAVCLLLSEVLGELGKLLLWAGLGILGASVENAVDNTAVKEKYEYLKEVAEGNGLTKKGEWKRDIALQAEKDAEAKYGENSKTTLQILNERQVRK